MKKLTKQVRGSEYYSVYGMAAFTQLATDRYYGPRLSFRLVHDDEARTVRGGSFYYGPDNARDADREQLGPDNYCDTFGFRLVRETT